jgi:hypothetical protein
MRERRAAERRAYPRIMPSRQIHAEVRAAGIRGADALVENISRGGVMLALREADVDPDENQCVVRFRGSRGVRPATSRGWIRRAAQGEGQFLLAVEFAEPLVALDVASSRGGTGSED